MVLDRMPDWLDARQLGAVAGQVEERDPRGGKRCPLLLHPLALMDRVVVYYQDERPLSLPARLVERRPSGHTPDKAHEPFSVEDGHLLHAQVVGGGLFLQALPPLL